ALFREHHSPYRIERALGAGLYTATYLANHEDSGRTAVVRVLFPEFANLPAIRSRFCDLTRLAFKLVHQNLIQSLDVRTFPDHHLYSAARHYIAGPTLQGVLLGGKKFTPVEVVNILRQLLCALAPAHERGVAHNSVKPSNIFITAKEGRVILGDL